MGEKGSKSSQDAAIACESVVQVLAPLGDVSSRKMFGGFGVFESGVMFALINSQGDVHLKVDDSNRTFFDAAGATQHGRMPYFQVPVRVLGDEGEFRDWAQVSVDIAHSAKKKN